MALIAYLPPKAPERIFFARHLTLPILYFKLKEERLVVKEIIKGR